MPASKRFIATPKAFNHQQASHFCTLPWHGLEAGPEPPTTELVAIPTLYGFIPRTYCGDRVQHLSLNQTKE